MASPLLKSSTLYMKKDIVGTGVLSIVSRVELDGKTFALKEFQLNKLESQDQRDDFLEEIKNEYNLLKMDLRFLVKSYGSSYDSQLLVYKFSMDYYPQNLRKLVENRGSLTLVEFLSLYRDIISGKYFLINIFYT